MDPKNLDLEALLQEVETQTLADIQAKKDELEVLEAEISILIDEDLRPFVLNKKVLFPAPSYSKKQAPISKPAPAESIKKETPVPTKITESDIISPSSYSPDLSLPSDITPEIPPIILKTPTISTVSPTPIKVERQKGILIEKAPKQKIKKTEKTEKSTLPKGEKTKPKTDENINVKIKSGEESEKEFKKRQEKLQDIIGKDKGGTI